MRLELSLVWNPSLSPFDRKSYGGQIMGSNSKQAQGIVLFIATFVLLARGLATGGNIVYFLAAIAVLALAIFAFHLAKAQEAEHPKV